MDNYYKINDQTIHTVEYIKDNSNKLMLCIHGAGSYYGNMFYKHLYQLNLDYNIILLDLRGHNKSTGQCYLDYNTNVQDVYDVLQQFLEIYQQIKHLTIIGHSNGVYIAIILAQYIQWCQQKLVQLNVMQYFQTINLQKKDYKLDLIIDRLILVSSRFVVFGQIKTRIDPQTISEIVNWKQQYYPVQFGRSVYQITRQTIIERQLLTEDVLLSMLTTVQNILLIHGTNDDVCNCQESQQIYDALDKQINKQLFLIEGATHISININQVKDILIKFLE